MRGRRELAWQKWTIEALCGGVHRATLRQCVESSISQTGRRDLTRLASDSNGEGESVLGNLTAYVRACPSS